MSRTSLFVAAMALGLAACSSGEKAANGGQPLTPKEAAAQVAASGIKLEPGEYETAVTLLDFTMAGLPADQVETMKAAMSEQVQKPRRSCLTPEEAAEGPKQLVSRMRDGDCRISDFASSANTVSGTMHCSFNGRGSSTTRFSGTYRSDGSSMTMESDQQLPGMPGDGMHMQMQADSRRLGDCTS